MSDETTPCNKHEQQPFLNGSANHEAKHEAEPAVAMIAAADSAPADKASSGLAIAALVLGICSILFSVVAFMGIALGILGLVFALRYRKAQGKWGVNTGGLVCSIVGLVFSVLFTILSMILAALIFASISAAMPIDEMQVLIDELEQDGTILSCDELGMTAQEHPFEEDGVLYMIV